MSKQFTVIFLILCAASFCFAQIGEWEKYSVPARDVSISFPRLPIKDVDDLPSCNGQQTERFAIYSAGTAYLLTVSRKVKPNKYCSDPKPFSDKNFAARLAEFAGRGREEIPATENTNNLPGIRFHADETVILLYNDPKNYRWFELAVFGEVGADSKANVFLNSFSIGKANTGIDIGEGWNGNAPVVVPPLASVGSGAGGGNVKPDGTGSGIGTGVGTGSGIGSGAGTGGGIGPGVGPGQGPGVGGIPSSSGGTAGAPVDARALTIVLKPRPEYTEEARKDQVTGVVRLRVVFNANGSIGSLTVVSGLKDGLTEQAIAAARKFVFVPARRNKVPYTISKLVEYNFNLY